MRLSTRHAAVLIGLLVLFRGVAADAGPTIKIIDLAEGGLQVTYDPANAYDAAEIDQPTETAKIRGTIPQNVVDPNGTIPRAAFAAVVLLEFPGGPISDVITLNISTVDPGTPNAVTKFLLTFQSDVEGGDPLTNPVPDPQHRNELVENGKLQDISALFVRSDGAMPMLDTTPAFTVMVQSDAPEPSTIALAAIGGLALLSYGRRRA